MLTKLTLTIERSTIDKAKAFAQKRHKSVSRIVEEYLKNLTEGNTLAALNETMKTPITDSLVGMFEDNGKEYKTMLEEALAEKFVK